MGMLVQEDTMLEELFDALPESVILFKPVYNSTNEVSDFEFAYCNSATCRFLNESKMAVLHETILTSSLVSESYKQLLYKQCLEVWQTGKPQENDYYHEELGKHFNSLRTRINKGVISIARDKTVDFNTEKVRQEEMNRFTAILDASADGVMILEAIRDEQKEVTDFRLTHCNNAAFALAKISPLSIGRTLLEILPHLAQSEQFALHREVIATGHPQRIETTFRNEKGEEYGWFIVSLMKVGDNVVSTFIDISEKKNHLEKIEEQAELLHSIFEASTNGIFACEAVRNEQEEIVDFNVIKINEAFTRIIGIRANIAEGATYHTLFPYGKTFGFFHLYCEVINTGKNLRREIYYDDERISGWFDVSAVKRGTNGIVITFTDITESKNDKKAVEDGSKYLQDVIDSSQTGILLLTPAREADGTIVDFKFKTANQTLAGLAGKHPSQLIGKFLTEVFADTADGIFEHFKEVADSSNSEKRFEYHYTAEGIDVWLDVLAKKRGGDLLITFLDFTSLRKLQDEIAAAAHKLSTVVNTASAGMFTLQPVYTSGGELEDFRFGIVNQAVVTYIGEKAENLAGALGSTYFPAYKQNGLFTIYKDTYLTNNQHQFDFHYEDGYDLYFNIHTVKAGNEVLVTFTDHTALKKLQVQLEATVEELKKLNFGLEEFAYAASHDLQEPLRKINYFAERLRKGIGERLSAEESKMFGRMENAAARMSQLINDLLTYSQISRNTQTFGTIDLDGIIQQVLSDLETRIAEKNATITAARLAEIHGDPVQLRQLFQNLLSNSLKYSKEDVAPIINISCEKVSKEINGSSRIFYQIEITDNGIGFDQEHAERIFKVFQRLHGQSEFPGTGIGLAIVQRVVENHHGTIAALGFPGQGSKFTISLPAL